MHNNFEILSVNGFSVVSVILAWFTQYTGLLTVLVLISSLVYNCINIYRTLKKKKSGEK